MVTSHPFAAQWLAIVVATRSAPPPSSVDMMRVILIPTARLFPGVRLWNCYEKHPRQRLSLTAGTVLKDSPHGLNKCAEMDAPPGGRLVAHKGTVQAWRPRKG
jgi:hypothetical protein